MKIPGHYINLDRADKRAAHMESEITRLGLPIQRLAAVDGTTLDREQMDAIPKPASGMHVLSAPEVGCLLSHRNAWEKIATGDSPFGAVFEDDLTFADYSAVLLNDDAWIPDGADIVKIETTSRKALLSPPFLEIGDDRQLAHLSSLHLGAGGYIVSRQAAADLVARSEKIGLPVDYILFDRTYMAHADISIWQLFPAICVQQVRADHDFLPAGAEASGLDSARKILKRKGWAKIRRELARPIKGLAFEISTRLTARQAGGKWVFIDYRK